MTCVWIFINDSHPLLQAGSWQAAIVTDGTISYFVGTYGLETSYDKLTCGPKFVSSITILSDVFQ